MESVVTTGITPSKETIAQSYYDYISEKAFPCVAAKAALAKQQLHCFVAGHMACPAHDTEILSFLYSFIDKFRESDQMYHSAAIVFTQPELPSEPEFEGLLWQRLQSLSNIDAQKYKYDDRVDQDPSSPNFSFSLKEEAFFIIGLHPNNSRMVRRFQYPTIVFNPHIQFEQLRTIDKYRHLKQVVRKRDFNYSGSINPMLEDFGNSSEVYQYSGKPYQSNWQCPLKINHARP